MAARAEDKALWFHPHPHLRKGEAGDKHVDKIVATPFIIPDARLINQPNSSLWASRGGEQVFITAFAAESPTTGPAPSVTGLIPDLHHYKGSFGGRVFPL